MIGPQRILNSVQSLITGLFLCLKMEQWSIHFYDLCQNSNITFFFSSNLLRCLLSFAFPPEFPEGFYFTHVLKSNDISLPSVNCFAGQTFIWWWVWCINASKYFLTLCYPGHDSSLPLLWVIIAPLILHVCSLWPDVQHTSMLFMVTVAVSSASMETELLWWRKENEGDKT